MPRQPPFHVWVDLTGRWAYPVPGVLVAWRHSGRRGWEASVVRAEAYPTGSAQDVQLVHAWMPATAVRPAGEAGTSKAPAALENEGGGCVVRS